MLDRMFSLEGPIVRFIFRVKDLVVLNLITIVCILPIFTFGPAVKALAFTSLKMVRAEDGNVVRTYFRNFKLNFKQTVGFGLICLALIIVAAGDVFVLIFMRKAFPTVFVVLAVIVVIIVIGILTYAIPMQGRFLNPIAATFKNAAMTAVMKFPSTVVMILCWLLLPALDLMISANFLPVIIAVGLSLPAYLNALVYEPVFADFEEIILNASEEEQE